MAETMRFEFIAQERIIVQDDVNMVVAPGASGILGILPRHQHVRRAQLAHHLRPAGAVGPGALAVPFGHVARHGASQRHERRGVTHVRCGD